MQPGLAGAGVVLASVASPLFNLPIICRKVRNPLISRRLAILTIVLSALGIAFLVLEQLKWSFGERGPGICGKARRLSTAD